MADDQAYLDTLRQRRATTAGIKSTGFADQITTFDAEALDREIARVERIVDGRSRTRYGAFSKGT